MSAVQSEVAGQIAALLAPALVEGVEDRPEVERLWSLLRGYPTIRGAARDPQDDELEADLTREIGRVLRDNRPLAIRVTQLVGEARYSTT
jgi:hypothetical protein